MPLLEPRLTHRYVLLVGPMLPGQRMLDEECVQSTFRPRSSTGVRLLGLYWV